MEPARVGARGGQLRYSNVAKEDHGDRCEGPEDCLILIHQHGPRDFILPSE